MGEMVQELLEPGGREVEVEFLELQLPVAGLKAWLGIGICVFLSGTLLGCCSE